LFDGKVDGRSVVKRSTTPFYDAAQVLLAEGVDPGHQAGHAPRGVAHRAKGLLSWSRDGVAWVVCHRRTELVRVVPDAKYPGMWLVRHLDCRLSDIVNLSRAKDAAASLALRVLNCSDDVGNGGLYGSQKGKNKLGVQEPSDHGQAASDAGTAEKPSVTSELDAQKDPALVLVPPEPAHAQETLP
jgi:hypothetical protein